MKWIKYNFLVTVNHGDDENPKLEEILTEKFIGYDENNLVIAQKEACDGEYTVEDDGIEENTKPNLDDRVQALEENNTEMNEALDMILSGVTE